MIKKLSDLSWEPFNIAIIGESSSGKTHLAATVPGRQLWFCFEQGLMTVAANPDLQDRLEFEEYLLTANPATVGKQFPKAMKDLLALKSKVDQYDVVIVDSLLSMTETCLEFCKEKLYNMAGKPMLPEKGVDYRPVYMALANYTYLFINELISLPISTILTCHEDYEKDETTGAMFYSMAIEGKKAALKIPKLYDEIWRTIAPRSGSKDEYKVQTRGGKGFKAKSRWDCFDIYEKPDISKMLVKVRAKFDKE